MERYFNTRKTSEFISIITTMKYQMSGHAVKEPIFITKNGYGGLVVMCIENYEQIMEARLIDNVITEAEAEHEITGILLDAKDTLRTGAFANQGIVIC